MSPDRRGPKIVSSAEARSNAKFQTNDMQSKDYKDTDILLQWGFCIFI